MKNIFVVSKNQDLPNYLIVLLKGIYSEEDFSLSLNFDEWADLVIIDAETTNPADAAFYQKGTPTLLFSYELTPALIQFTAKYDINGVLSLEMEASDLSKTLESAINKDIFYCDAMISLLFSNKINELAERVASLTDRENEIIVMMMKDLTNEEIASNLNLSVRTVNAHKGNIIRKMGAKTTSGLIKMILDYSPLIKNEF